MVKERKPGMQIPETLAVVALGVELFADSLREQGVKTVSTAWTPPADAREARILDMLVDLDD